MQRCLNMHQRQGKTNDLCGDLLRFVMLSFETVLWFWHVFKIINQLWDSEFYTCFSQQ